MSALAFSVLECLSIPNISSGSRMALTALLSYRNRTTGQCNPKITTLIERLGGVHERRLYRWLAELRTAGIVISTKHRGPNSYEFHIATTRECRPDKNVRSGPDKNVRSGPDKNVRSGPDKNVRESGGPSLYEPEVFEQKCSAAVACVPTPAAAAAAATATLCTTEEHPTHPTPAPVVNPSAMAEAAENLCVELMAAHPEPGNLPGAIAEAERILAKAPEDLEATVEAMRSSHAACSVRSA